MITVNNETLANIPCLHIAKQEKWNDQLPLILFIHGFTSAKEHNLHYAYLLAEEGFRVILPDAPYHGERENGLTESKLMHTFWDIVIQIIHELDYLRMNLEEKGIVDSSRIGLAGTSMGGIVTLGALSQFKWVHSAVSLMGSPSYVDFANWQVNQMNEQGIAFPYSEEELEDRISSLKPFDLSIHHKKLEGRPLLFWHGEADSVVPYHFAQEFIRQNSDMQISVISEPGVGHKVSRKGVLATIEWFKKQFLA